MGRGIFYEPVLLPLRGVWLSWETEGGREGLDTDKRNGEKWGGERKLQEFGFRVFGVAG